VGAIKAYKRVMTDTLNDPSYAARRAIL